MTAIGSPHASALPDESLRKLYARELGFLNETDAHLILDFGCGRGWLSFMSASIKRGAHIIGVDVFLFNVKYAQRESSLKPREIKRGISFIACTGENLPFRGDVFDTTMVIRVLHHFKDFGAVKRAINELRRIMKGKGHLLIQEPVRNNPIHFICRKIFFHIPRSLKIWLLGEELLYYESTVHGAISSMLPFTAGMLKRCLQSNNFDLVKDLRGGLFAGFLDYLGKIFPPVSYLPSIFFSSLCNLDSLLSKNYPFRALCGGITFYCVKQ